MQLVSVEKKVFKDGLQNLWRGQEIRHGGLMAKKNIEFTPLLGEGPQSLSRAEQRTLRAINPIPFHSAVLYQPVEGGVCSLLSSSQTQSCLEESDESNLGSMPEAGKVSPGFDHGMQDSQRGKVQKQPEIFNSWWPESTTNLLQPKNIWC